MIPLTENIEYFYSQVMFLPEHKESLKLKVKLIVTQQNTSAFIYSKMIRLLKCCYNCTVWHALSLCLAKYVHAHFLRLELLQVHKSSSRNK